MLIHHGLQVAPLTLLRSGGLSVPTPRSPCPSRRVLLECRRLLLCPQRGRCPPIGSSLFAPRTAFIFGFEYMQMLQWSHVKGNYHYTPPCTHTHTHHYPHPSPFIFPALFLFCLSPNCCLLCSVGRGLGGWQWGSWL